LKKRDGSDDESEDGDDDEEDVACCPLPQEGAYAFNREELEMPILEAADRVKLAKVQRQLFNSHIAKDREDAMDEVPHSERTYMQIGNYCRKMEMPYF
jgi:hypothetical protein